MKTLPWHRILIGLAIVGVFVIQLLPLNSPQYFATVWLTIGILIAGLTVKTMR